MPGSANLNIMLKAARKVGRSLVKDFREVENLQVSMKGAGDFVSRADIAAEKILEEELRNARPTYGWLAEKGEGAWMNESRIRVSWRHKMIESIFATGLPFGGRSDLPATLQDLARLMPVCAGVRRWGSAALDMAYVAAGRYEGFWERRLNAWDLAAGIIIVQEAGGFVEPLTEGDDILVDGNVICGNELIFDKFTKAVRGR